MSQNATELRLLVVGDLFGDVAVRVLEVLLQHGRTTHPTLLRQSGLGPRQLKHTLVVLIHHELVKCYQPESIGTAYYEADWTTAYALVKTGKLVSAVTQRFGDLAGAIISHILANGHTRVSELINSKDVLVGGRTKLLAKSAQTNGLSNGKRKLAEISDGDSEDSMHKAMLDLLEIGYLTVLHESHLRPQADNIIEATWVCRQKLQPHGVLKKSEQVEVDRAARALLQVWKSNDEGIKTQGSVNHLKRQFQDANLQEYNHEKKRKINGGHAINDPVHLNLDLILRVNHDKLAVMTRNQHLVGLVEERISKPCSKLYATFLDTIQKDIKACNVDKGIANEDGEADDYAGPGITTKQIADLTRNTVNLVGSVGTTVTEVPGVEHQDHPKKRRRKDDDDDPDENDYVSGIVDDQDLEDDEGDYVDYVPKRKILPAPAGQTHDAWVEQNLKLLASYEPPFLICHAGTASSPTRWTVSFPPLCAALRMAQIYAVIGHKHTRASLRLVRILSEKGVLDEKTLISVSLLPTRELRQCLTGMYETGLLEVQEIPRDTNRQPGKTLFLWFFDLERARYRLLEDSYKAMARALQRAREESEESTVRAVVEKASRSDVQGREKEFLSAAELATLQAWREREERLLGSVARLDELVTVLRDY